ncbi:hypothetical protein L6452_30076 [Arctium lappa]|uniref:Uncharacterized protein n=1 Tax=Arctium lappa TaxID=4217 RepID=A0ACB8ZHP3_ARCLA|nr:hypothetical protein L6452_30076 [Arctium lappa]
MATRALAAPGFEPWVNWLTEREDESQWRLLMVLIFSQWTKILDIMHYYFSEKGMEVYRIDGNVKLEERRRQKEWRDEGTSSKRKLVVFVIQTNELVMMG